MREKPLFLRAKGDSITAIVGNIGRNKGTISRKLRRNSVDSQWSQEEIAGRLRAEYGQCVKKLRHRG